MLNFLKFQLKRTIFIGVSFYPEKVNSGCFQIPRWERLPLQSPSALASMWHCGAGSPTEIGVGKAVYPLDSRKAPQMLSPTTQKP